MDAHRNHKHFVIELISTRAVARRVLRLWKTNVDAIRGGRTIFDKLRAAEEALAKARDDARKQRGTLERVRADLADAQRRNEMLEVAMGN